MSHSPNVLKVAIAEYYYMLLWSVKRCCHQGNYCLALQSKQIDVLRSVTTNETSLLLQENQLTKAETSQSVSTTDALLYDAYINVQAFKKMHCSYYSTSCTIC